MNPIVLQGYGFENVVTIKKVKRSTKRKNDTKDISGETNKKIIYTIESEGNIDNLILDDCVILPGDNEFNNSILLTNVNESDSFENTQNDREIGSSNDVKPLADVVEALKCRNCDYLTLDKSQMVEHVQNVCNKQDSIKEIEKTMYICGKCSISLSSVEECRKHMMEDHKLKDINSENDEKNITDKQTLKNNKKENNQNISKPPMRISKAVEEYWSQPRTKKEAQAILCENRKIKCTIKKCLYRFNSDESMITHRSCHVEPTPPTNISYQKSPQRTLTPPYICSICKISCNNWPSCSLHLWREHQISLDLLLCPLCSTVRTHSVSKMIQHLARHWRSIQSKINNSKVDSDVNIEESDQTLNLPRWYAKTQCKICNKYFSDCKSLKNHIQGVHKKIKPFICNVCGHSTGRKHMLQLHMRQHTGEKPFICNYCNYRTGDHNTLRKHIMRHTGERPYKCNFCTYSSIQSAPLKLHIKTVHNKTT